MKIIFSLTLWRNSHSLDMACDVATAFHPCQPVNDVPLIFHGWFDMRNRTQLIDIYRHKRRSTCLVATLPSILSFFIGRIPCFKYNLPIYIKKMIKSKRNLYVIKIILYRQFVLNLLKFIDIDRIPIVYWFLKNNS